MISPKELMAINVKRIRLSRGMTQTELANRAKVSLKLIQSLEYSTVNPSNETIMAVTKVLKCSVADLYVDPSVPNSTDYRQAAELLSKFADLKLSHQLVVLALLNEDPTMVRNVPDSARPVLQALLKAL